MINVLKEDAEKMANWWADQIANPNQNMGTEEQGGNDTIIKFFEDKS